MPNTLEQDIISTAESFTKNFEDKGNFNFSIESLHDVDDLLDELCDFELDEDHLDSVSSMVGCYVEAVKKGKETGYCATIV
ncbi:hypothetical protein EHV15_00995 [Paenibacillus oralis]|uniref:Uncharacterized protein n=1 Tax=Paenibacillus oralis TaxID=2490856 RepID=A0A3P3TWS7_9BACL|nr:hypothetical protein [Paenibacillus oralis]RRJ61708.1 hypothetical protein EHV15_00995 [Paenibacillus oralis]